MTPGFMLHLLMASGLVEMQNAAARGRGVDDACTVPVGPEKVADQATQKVAEQATFHVADSATPEVADSATKNRPAPNDRPPTTAGCAYDCGNCWRGPDQPYAVCPLSPTLSPSLRQSLAGSLPATHHHESDTMSTIPSLNPFDTAAAQVRALPLPAAAQVQALSGALDAAGKLHAQAFGSATIRGLIYELAKCQDALAGFLPKGDPADIAPAATPSKPLASPLQAPGQRGASESRDTPHAVNTLVATAYRATRDNLAAMQAARDELSMQMAHQRERLLDLQEHFGSEEDAMRALETYLGPLP